MRRKRKGVIVNISSIAGLVGIPSQSVYVATKFAVEGLSESLSYELETFGIKIILVEPRVINTKFVQSLIVPNNRYKIEINQDQTDRSEFNINNNLLSPYNNTIKKFLSFYYNAMINAPHPHIVANEIIQGIETMLNGKNTLTFLRVNVGKDSGKYSKLKKELSDNELHEIIKEDLLK
jgi:short-subunit dehydrogenase